MITYRIHFKFQRFFRILRIFVVMVSMILSQFPGGARARSEESTKTIDLNLSVKDITRVDFGYHYSSFESTDTAYKLDVKAGSLTNGNVKAPLSILNSLVSGLHGMYPGTRPLTWQKWTDDYPHAWIDLYLNDGRLIEIASDSQFNGMFPWNVSSWSSEKAAQPDAMYIQVNPTFLGGIDALWRGVGQPGFPRGQYSESFWKDMLGDPAPETVKFNVPEQYSPDMDASDTAPVWGASPALMAPFLAELSQNAEIKTLLDAGYIFYDAAFTLEVKTQTLEPVKYSGMLALGAPNGGDAVVGQVTIPLTTGQPVTTTLRASDSMQLVEQRRASHFLNGVAQILTPLTFILDTRSSIKAITLDCPEDQGISLDGQAIQAIWNSVQPMRVTFYPLKGGRWTADLGLQRVDPNWNDSLVQTILNAWFPEAIAALPVQDLQAFDTGWKIALQPDVSLRDPNLMTGLESNLPEQMVVHVQDPEKVGDYSFLKMDGRVVISENGAAPGVVYCGIKLPDWYGPAYPIGSVLPPNDQVSRSNMPGGIGGNGEWRSLSGPLPSGQYSAEWTSIAFSQPGFLHVLWTVEREGVYYADGWIDGTGWSIPQRLGDEAYWVDIRAWSDGEVHLFWDAGLTTGGTIHVWKPAGGTWQKPEHWPNLDYFGEILRDSSGTLNIGGIASDGLDSEFMYWTWSPEKGLSAPENISRHIGDIGNGNYILRFDSRGQLHAAWSHILDQQSAPDPLTQETSDISGVFYARRLPDGHWSKPEQVGTLAPYAHALSMELDAQDNPLILWQTDNGLSSRIRKNGVWEDAVELVKVKPPDTPAEFGPGRQVQPTAELKTGVNTNGQIIVGWLIPYTSLRMAIWSGTGWTDPVDIVPTEDINRLQSDTSDLEMIVDNQDRVHFVFFEEQGSDGGSELYYADYDHQKVDIHPLSITYYMYGLPVANLVVDTTGSVAVLGLPRSPGFAVKMALTGIPPTPVPTPTLTATPLPSFTPEDTPTPLQPPAVKGGLESFILLIIGIGILFTLIIIAIVALRSKK
jgi:hypothetical protein